MEYETLQFTEKGPVATVVLNRPRTLNALNAKICKELSDALTVCAGQEGIRAVILTGAGKAFSSGGDLQEMGMFLNGGDQDDLQKMIEDLNSAVNSVILAIRKIPKPVIGAINGVCSGGGAGLAMACDILLASENAAFNVPNLRIGLAPDGGNSYFFTRSLGRHRAAEWLFTGETMNVHEAYRWGLFNRILAPQDLLPEAETLAERLAQAPSMAIGLAKDMMDRALFEDLETQLEREKEAVLRCAGTWEFKEGISAFFQKRRPSFNGL